MPAYNEANAIYKSVLQTIEELSNFCSCFEIVVVNDGSTDDTYEEIKKVSSVDKRVIPINISENVGKGNALKFGTKVSRGDLVAFLDADMDLHPAQLESFMAKMENENADVVIGSKIHKDSEVDYPLQRRIISRIYYFGLAVLFRLKVSDTQVGIKLFKGDLIREVMEKILVKRFAYDVEVLVLCSKKGAKIIDHPVKLDYQRGGPWGRMRIKDLWHAAWDTMAIFYRLYILRYYDKEQP